ncbi:MAG: GTPase domain-containing protein [Candidatus Heimdallarchaeum aukensis]|uniref:GTPase domain-containing protein n=1 Tax=Candidatus Heimdallarchaeum aukensis TaxID=2876573 RepID=A0A9Y1FLK1_9ARCH|nr:MAG: GTPase domain-containing protein [Candidatus Heimdallarchaeum aukensis]
MVPTQMKKITILGTTGSGKTTFLEALFGDFEKNDVKRDLSKEKSSNCDFIPLKNNTFKESTTTISLNVINSLLYLTTFNRLGLEKFENRDNIDFENVEEIYQIVFNDPAGQERFDFMQEIAVRGANLVIIMADGTNISSLEKVVHYISLVKIEENLSKKKIPTIIFINKSDLKEKGVYLGKNVAEQIIYSSILDEKLLIYETSNLKRETYDEPLRIIFNYLSY